jgi:hypothetical protein
MVMLWVVSPSRTIGAHSRFVLSAAGEVDGPLAFPGPVLEALRALVPCDVVTFHERSAGPERVLVYAGQPIGDVTPEIRAAHRCFKHQDPFRPADGARKLSDFISPREYRGRKLYHCVDRPLGVEHMLQLFLDPRSSDARLEFDISPETVRKHLENAFEKLGVHTRTAAVAAVFG